MRPLLVIVACHEGERFVYGAHFHRPAALRSVGDGHVHSSGVVLPRSPIVPYALLGRHYSRCFRHGFSLADSLPVQRSRGTGSGSAWVVAARSLLD